MYTKNLECMEQEARRLGPQINFFTVYDVLSVEFYEDWVPGTQFEYKHNGVIIDRARAAQLIG